MTITQVFPLITFFFVDSFIFLIKFILTNDEILATFRINDQEVIVNLLKLNHKKLPEIFVETVDKIYKSISHFNLHMCFNLYHICYISHIFAI